MIEIGSNSELNGRPHELLDAWIVAQHRRADECTPSLQQLIKHLGSADFCRPRS